MLAAAHGLQLTLSLMVELPVGQVVHKEDPSDRVGCADLGEDRPGRESCSSIRDVEGNLRGPFDRPARSDRDALPWLDVTRATRLTGSLVTTASWKAIRSGSSFSTAPRSRRRLAGQSERRPKMFIVSTRTTVACTRRLHPKDLWQQATAF
jgi:hypothetical protein